MAKNLPRAERIDKARKAWRLATRGRRAQSTIADELGVSQATVSRWLAAQSARVVASLDVESKTELVVTLRQVNEMIEDLWDAWKRSKENRRRSSKQTQRNADGSTKLTVENVEMIERDGDPAFLDRIRDLWNYRARLLQLETRFAPAAADVGPAATTAADAVRDAHARDAAYQPDPDDEAPADGE